MELHMIEAKAQIEFVLACTLAIGMYCWAFYFIYEIWRDEYMFDIFE